MPPNTMTPKAKLPKSPIKPIIIGMTPPPIKNAKGMVSDTATLLIAGGMMVERSANAGGKKQTEIRDWANTTANTSQ